MDGAGGFVGLKRASLLEVHNVSMEALVVPDGRIDTPL